MKFERIKEWKKMKIKRNPDPLLFAKTGEADFCYLFKKIFYSFCTPCMKVLYYGFNNLLVHGPLGWLLHASWWCCRHQIELVLAIWPRRHQSGERMACSCISFVVQAHPACECHMSDCLSGYLLQCPLWICCSDFWSARLQVWSSDVTWTRI